MAQININQFQKPNVSLIELIGTEGNLVLDAAALKFANDDSGKWEASHPLGDLDVMTAHEARFVRQATMMLDLLDGESCCLTTLEEARDNLCLALAAKESYRTKRIIQL